VRRRSSLLLAAVLAVLGFLLVTAAFTTRHDKRAAEPRKEELISQILDRRSQVDDLDQAVRQLQDQVAAAERADARRNLVTRDATERNAVLATQAGTTAMKGPAVVVHLSDSSRTPEDPTVDTSAYKIHDADLQLVVNALFGAGAEAVAVNNNRIVATTPIRAAGSTIVVNFRPLTPPYRVVGIGASESRFNDSDIARRFRRWTKLFGLGFSTSHSASATVPAFTTGQVPIDDAKPVGG
jgi:uncharacterized protein YlxW (UPF0749 family)